MRRRGGEGLFVSVSVSECVFVWRKKEVENRKTALEREKELKTRTNIKTKMTTQKQRERGNYR